jgi:hypothetical protein
MKRAFGNAVLSAVSLSALVFAARPSPASVQFQNTGSSSGWSTLYVEHNGSVTTISSPVYKGSTSMRARQIYDSSYGGRYHAEGRKSGLQKRGSDNYYGWVFRLPSNWQFVDQNYNMQQFIANFSGCSGGQPTTMNRLRGNVFVTRVVTGPNGCDRTSTNINVTSGVTANTWHRIVMRGKWRSDSTGVFQVWYDGSKKVDRTGSNIPAVDSGYTGCFGMYANGWYDDKKMVGTQGTREWYIDQIRQATSYNEADPAQW